MKRENDTLAAQMRVRDAAGRAFEVMGGAKYEKLNLTGFRYWTPARVVYLLLAVMLVVFGFAIDGSSAAGHHLGLIAGGIFCGWGLKK